MAGKGPEASLPAPLSGLRVIDCATLFAGPVIASMMGDFGADVVKVEHPSGDSLRSLGWTKDGVSLWWALVSRNKRCVTLDLSDAQGQSIFGRLCETADVMIENFRPGTLERWNLGPEILLERNPGLVIVRTTAFGQTGPYSTRPGFGTLAEAMSGFAHMNGWPDRPPSLPPFALADGVAALTGAFAAMTALRWRDMCGGTGQVIDLSIYEPLFAILGPQAGVYDALGIVGTRTGNRTPFSAPRNLYQSKDGRWLAVSATSTSIAVRLMGLVGRPDIVEEPWFADHTGRLQHSSELDSIIGEWIGMRNADEVLAEFERVHAAVGPVLSIDDIVTDAQYVARETVVRVADERLGSLLMQNVVPRLGASPGAIRHLGPALGAHNEEIYSGELGLDEALLSELTARKVI